jgi:hypothetical protein
MPIGYGGTLNQLVNSTAPDKGVGLSLNIPLRNREAQANQVRSGTRIPAGASPACTNWKIRCASKCATRNST